MHHPNQIKKIYSIISLIKNHKYITQNKKKKEINRLQYINVINIITTTNHGIEYNAFPEITIVSPPALFSKKLRIVILEKPFLSMTEENIIFCGIKLKVKPTGLVCPCGHKLKLDSNEGSMATHIQFDM